MHLDYFLSAYRIFFCYFCPSAVRLFFILEFCSEQKLKQKMSGMVQIQLSNPSASSFNKTRSKNARQILDETDKY